MQKIRATVKKIDDALEMFSVWGLFLALILMVTLSLLNMALRWFSTTLLWVDPVVRYLVFLCAFLGGSVATRAGKHIRIDILARILEAYHFHRINTIMHRIVDIFCIGMLSWLIKASHDFYLLEAEFGKIEFLGIHSSYMVAIVPCGLFLVLLRFVAQLVASFEQLPRVK